MVLGGVQRALQVLTEVVSEIKVFIGQVLNETSVSRVVVQMHFDCFAETVAHEAQVNNGGSHAYFLGSEGKPIITSFFGFTLVDKG